jgi:hypothetical protein
MMAHAPHLLRPADLPVSSGLMLTLSGMAPTANATIAIMVQETDTEQALLTFVLLK